MQKNGEKQERWDQVKLIRSEWSRPTSAEKLYSRVLYISNLKVRALSLFPSLFIFGAASL